MIIESLLANIAIRAHSKGSKVASNQATFSEGAYQQWRDSELKRQLLDNFNPELFRNKRVLDFGCGSGEMSFLAASLGSKSVIGIELSEKQFSLANAKDRPANVTFVRATDPKTIDLPDQSVDIILCFDVMEHIMDYREIFREWKRVLAPGGKVLIWWSVWLHPYGHHELHVLPLPWIHLFLSMPTIYRACAKVYDSPAFSPRKWHFDESGRRKHNPYLGASEPTDLNKLTIRKAERELKAAGLRVHRRELQPFTGKRLAWLKKSLVRLPIPDPFCSAVIYEIGH